MTYLYPPRDIQTMAALLKEGTAYKFDNLVSGKTRPDIGMHGIELRGLPFILIDHRTNISTVLLTLNKNFPVKVYTDIIERHAIRI